MSVLHNFQKQTTAHYIEWAESIYLVCIKLVTRMNNRYFVILGEPLIQAVYKLKEECKIANNLRTDDLREISSRRESLHKCQGYFGEVVCQLSTIETLTLEAGNEMFITSKHDSMSLDRAKDFVNKRLIEMLDHISKLQSALQSLLNRLNECEEKLM